MEYPKVQYELVTAESTNQLDTKIISDIESKEKAGLQLIDMNIQIADTRDVKALLKYASHDEPLD